MHKKLTEEQVAKLFAFCQKNEIYAFDLQIEIVDHLASSIEEQWQGNPELTFGWALKNALDKFGKTRLKKLEHKLRRQLKQNFNRILFSYLLEYFRWPKIVITVIVFLSIFTLLQFTNNNFRILLFISIPVSLFSIYYHFFIFPKKFDINITNNKTFELIDYLKNINARIGSVAQLPFILLIASNDAGMRSSNTIKMEILIAFLFSLLLVFFYGHFFFLPQKIREYFFRNYSEFAK